MKKTVYLLFGFLVIIMALTSCSNQIYSGSTRERLVVPEPQNVNNQIVDLGGNWEFYWKQLLEPGDLDSYQGLKELVQVPHSWTDLGYPEEGYATYRLKAELQPDTLYGLELNNIATAYKLYLDGQLIATRGQFANQKSDSVSKLASDLILFKTQHEQAELVIQVSSYSYYQGGIAGRVLLGDPYRLQQYRYRDIALIMCLSGILLSFAVYHLLFYLHRRKDFSNLYFSVASFLVFMQTIFEGRNFFSSLFPAINLQAEEKIQTILLIMILPAVVASIHSIFKKFSRRKVVYFFTGSSLLLIVATAAIPFSASNPVWPIFGGLIGLGIIYLLYVLIRNLMDRNPHAWFFLVGIVCLVAATAYDYLIDYRIVQSYKLFSVGWVIFLGMVSITITSQMASSVRQVENLSAEINRKNVDLKQAYEQVEKKVEERTTQLNEAKKSLETANKQLTKDKKMLKVISITDGLTGLFNHNCIIGELKREINRSQRYGNALSVIMLDIDHFKRVNDQYGHQKGDMVLNGIGTLIKKTKRKADIAGRYGGEEFIIIMPETEIDSAHLLGERLKETIALNQWGINHLSVTISGGVAQYEEGMDYSQLLGKADLLLYRAKKEGRNRIER